jgi:hypothetical protein
MNRFAETLGAVAERLDLPQPAKSRILLELAADLEDLYEFHRQQGCSAEEAAREARQTLALSEESLAALVAVHQSWYRKLMDRFSARAQARWERLLLLLLLLCVVAVTGARVWGSPLLARAGLSAWPILAVTTAVVVLGATQFHKLYLKKDHRPGRLRRPLNGFLYLGGLNALLALGAAGIGLHRTCLAAARDAQQAYATILAGALATSATLIVALFAILLTAILWFVLLNKVICIEIAEAALLLDRGRRA